MPAVTSPVPAGLFGAISPSAHVARTLQVRRVPGALRQVAVSDDDDGRILAAAGLVRLRLGDVLHQRLEVLAGHLGARVRKPTRRIRGRIGEAVVVNSVAVTSDPKF